VNYTAPETFRTRTDARTFLSATHTDIVRGTFTNPRLGRMTVKEVGTKWLASNPTKSPASIARDQSILDVHVYPTLGKVPIGKVTKGQIQDLVNRWTGAPSSIGRQYSSLAALFNYSVGQEWLSRSPCRDTHLPTVVDGERYELTPEDIANIARATSVRLRPTIAIGATTGMRWAEVFALRVWNVDLAGSALNVAGGITRGSDGNPVAGNQGSRKAKPRSIPIGPKLVEMLTAHIVGLGPSALLFPDVNGGFMRYTNWRRDVWLPALEKAKLLPKEEMEDNVLPAMMPVPGFHDLRRLNATHLAGTTDVKTMMARLGIETPRVALRIYAKAVEQRERDAALAMEDFAMSHVGRTEESEESP